MQACHLMCGRSRLPRHQQPVPQGRQNHSSPAPARLTSSTISSSRLGSWEASQAHSWATSAALEKKAPRRSSSTASAVCRGAVTDAC